MTLVASGFDSRQSPHLLVYRGQRYDPAGRTAFDGRNVDAKVEVLRCSDKGHAWSHLYPVHALVSQRQRNRNESPDSGGSNPPKCTEPDWPEQMYPSSKGVGVDSRSRLNVFPPMRERDTVG